MKHMLRQEFAKRSSEAVSHAAMLRDVELKLSKIRRSETSEPSSSPANEREDGGDDDQRDAAAAAAATAVDSQLITSSRKPAISGSAQSEQLVALEVEIENQKEINRQLLTRNAHTTQLIQLLHRELQQRSGEAVVTAARLREVESQLSEIHPPPQTSDQPSPAATQQQRMEDESECKSMEPFIHLHSP